MRILVLGGSVFLGRHVVRQAAERGWDVTVANRGITATELPPGVARLAIDRDAGDVAALRGATVDAVIDTSAYRPGAVADALGALGAGAGVYCLVSTISVYAEPHSAGADEDAPRLVLPAGDDPASVPIAERYGELKAACEDVLAAAAVPALVVRPGLIVGPDDPTERFTSWPRRAARGGPLLCGEPEQPVQVLDVRDLARFLLDAVAAGATGTVNAAGPDRPTMFADLVAACVAAGGGRAEPVWAGEERLVAAGVAPWMGLPLWLPRADWGFLEVATARARALGLAPRPLADTVAATLAWDAARPAQERRDLLDPAREGELLAALR